MGLLPITPDWKLDSIVLQIPNRGLDCFLDNVNDTTYGFLENKWYCQYWKNQKINRTKPYHKFRKIYYTKSFWLWENKIDFEYNIFINPNSKIAEYERLETITHWQNDGEIYGHLTYIKNGEHLLIDFDENQSMYGFEKAKVDSILIKWKLK